MNNLKEILFLVGFVFGFIAFNVATITGASRMMYNNDKKASEVHKKFKDGLMSEKEYKESFRPTMLSIILKKNFDEEVDYITYVYRVLAIMLIVAIVSLGIAVVVPMLIEGSR